jgi:hypothetical protein
MRIVRYCILCGEIQERFGYWNNENFAVMPRTLGGNAYWLERIMLQADLRIGPHFRLCLVRSRCTK